MKHDGRMPVTLNMDNDWLDCKKKKIKGSDKLSKSCTVRCVGVLGCLPPPPPRMKTKLLSNIIKSKPVQLSGKNPGSLFGFLCSDHLLMAICPKVKLWPLPVLIGIPCPPQMRKLAYTHVNSSGSVVPYTLGDTFRGLIKVWIRVLQLSKV